MDVGLLYPVRPLNDVSAHVFEPEIVILFDVSFAVRMDVDEV